MKSGRELVRRLVDTSQRRKAGSIGAKEWSVGLRGRKGYLEVIGGGGSAEERLIDSEGDKGSSGGGIGGSGRLDSGGGVGGRGESWDFAVRRGFDSLWTIDGSFEAVTVDECL